MHLKRTLTPLNGYQDMKWAIEKAGAWFIGSFMLEFVESYEVFQDKNTKAEYIEKFMKEYNCVTADMNQLRNRINLAIRIIESDMVAAAMDFVLKTNDAKLGCDESKVNARFLLERLSSGETVLPNFESVNP